MKRSAIQRYFAELSFDSAPEECASKTAGAKKTPRRSLAALHGQLTLSILNFVFQVRSSVYQDEQSEPHSVNARLPATLWKAPCPWARIYRERPQAIRPSSARRPR